MAHMGTLGKDAYGVIIALVLLDPFSVAAVISLMPHSAGTVGRRLAWGAGKGAMLTPGRTKPGIPTSAVSPNAQISDPVNRDSRRAYQSSRRHWGSVNCIL